MRYAFLIAAMLASMPAMAQRAPFKAPEATPPQISAPGSMAPSPLSTPADMAPHLQDAPALEEPKVSQPQATTPEIMTIPGPLTPPGVPDEPMLTVPPLDTMSAGAPRLTSAEDVARSRAETSRKVKERRDRQTAIVRKPAVATPAAQDALKTNEGAEAGNATSTPGPVLVPVPVVVAPAPAPCMSNDIAELLSPNCMARFRNLPVGTTPVVEAPKVQCAIAIFPAQGAAALPTPFPMASVQQCVAAGVGMGAGFPGLTNIVAADPETGVFRVSCRRPGSDGRSVECAPQE